MAHFKTCQTEAATNVGVKRLNNGMYILTIIKLNLSRSLTKNGQIEFLRKTRSIYGIKMYEGLRTKRLDW